MDNLYRIIGVQRKANSDAEKRIKLLVEKIFSLLEERLDVEFNEYENIQQMIREKRSAIDEHYYFWDWMEDHGLNDLKYILRNNLIDLDEIHVLLDYREMVLELDTESNNLDNIFTSIADTVLAIKEYIDIYSQQSATVEPKNEYHYKTKTIKYPEYHISSRHDERKNSQWVISSENPAEIRQDFCYY